MNLIQVDPRFLDRVWPQVADELSRAVAVNSGEETLDQVKLQVRNGRYLLLLLMEGEDLLTVAVTEFWNLPNMRVAHVAYAAKSLPAAGVELYKQWAAANGATQVQAFCAETQARLFERRGFKPVYHVMRLSL